jgi:hypothetical protein
MPGKQRHNVIREVDDEIVGSYIVAQKRIEKRDLNCFHSSRVDINTVVLLVINPPSLCGN